MHDLVAPEESVSGGDRQARQRGGHKFRSLLSFRRISALYIFGAMFIVFALLVPETFLTAGTWRSMLDTQALTALVAVGLMIPVAAGAFDLAVGAEFGLATIVVSWMLVDMGTSPFVAICVALLSGAAVGLVSGVLVTFIKIDSFIATLAMSSVAVALTMMLSGGSQILNLPIGLSDFVSTQILGLTVPVWIMIAVALIVWYVFDFTQAGRQAYATGGNPAAARLAGVRTSRVIICALVACGFIASIAGILMAFRLGTGDPTIGPSYLLPAFTAVFLGSTQFRPGRFNVWGTVVSVYVLATGVTGLQLAGAPFWIPNLFNGVALILAVGASTFGASGFAEVRRSLRRVVRRTA